MKGHLGLTVVPNLGTVVPNMGTTYKDNIASALFGKTKREVLALLFSHSDKSYYLREIVRETGVGQGAVQRELEQLVKAGLVARRQQGRQVYYQASKESPVFPELRGLLVKTVGVADALIIALSPLADKIDVAFIYGSVAKGTETSASDVDVMVIGNAGFGEVVAALGAAQRELGREVNPSVFTGDEIKERIARSDHFVTTVMREPKVFLIGSDDDIRKLG